MREDAKKLEETRWLFEERPADPLRSRPPSASETMPKKRFEQRLEDYRNGKGREEVPQRRLRRSASAAGLAFVVYCCVASLVNQEEIRGSLEAPCPESGHARSAEAQAARDRSGRAPRGAGSGARPRNPAAFTWREAANSATAPPTLRVRHMRDG